MRYWNGIQSPLLFAHRGASVQVPENSVAAFHQALALGADVLETDLHVTRDDHFVLSHDPSGLRMAGIDRSIAECTLSEIRNWDIGFGLTGVQGVKPFSGPGMTIPTLEEALTACPEALFNVDIKQAVDHQLGPLIELIERHRATDRVLLTSFSGKTLHRVRALGYRGPTGMSRPEVLRLALLPLAANRLIRIPGQRLQVPPRHFLKRFADRDFIRKCHDLGLAVDFWVINRVEEAADLLALGADGIITDDPGTLSQLFRMSPLTTNWRERHNAVRGSA